MALVPHLYFVDACESALRFYVACGLGEIRSLRRYGGTPAGERLGAAWAERVLHAELVGADLRLFAGDGPDSEPMKGCALLLERSGVDEARALFDRLSEGGRITVPFAAQFFGHYGNFTDRFGVQWAVLAPP